MRFGGIVLALLSLVGCSSRPAAAPPASSTATTTTTTSTTPTAPDPETIEPRIKAAQLTADLLRPLGYVADSRGEGQHWYRVVSCPEQLETDGWQSATKTASHWVDPRGRTSMIQYTVSYGKISAAAETVRLARQSLECGAVTIADDEYTSVDELEVPPLGADAQFAVCYHAATHERCELLLSKADLLTVLTIFTPQRARASQDLEAAGRAVLPLLT
ncbi:hypothetical protein GCM10010492_04160 [Saccharothrix mutabilis subsp. mutabilis]|uniref:PknH-like extracellular domain-containing protein n=1 Tax=Saccharothrix mutabilis subsp. mutabilis TaxID=66855 RepID=A0ABN0T1Q8_9PSEU